MMKNRTNIFVCISMVLFLMTTCVKSQGIRYFDKYGDEVGLAYTGGYAIINCTCTEKQHFEWVYNENTVTSEEECPSQEFVSTRIDFTDKTNFGDYGCRINGKQQEVSMKFNYRLCGDEDEECRQPCTDRNSFCIVDVARKHPCTKFNILECDEQHPPDLKHNYCPGDRFRSMCDVIGANNVWSILVEQSVDCQSNPANVLYKEVQHYGTPFRINNTRDRIQIYCPSEPASNANATWTIKRHDGTVVSNGIGDKNGKCISAFPLPISESIFKSGSQVYKLKIDFNSGSATASLWNLLIVFGGIVNLEEEKTDDGGYTKSVTCKLRPKPSPEFVVSFMWIEDGKEVATVDGSANAESTHDILGNVKEVKCKCLVSYTSCKPYRQEGPFLNISESQPMNVKPAPGATASQLTVSGFVQSTGGSPGQATKQDNSTTGLIKTESSTKDASGMTTGTLIAIGVSVGIGLIGIAIGVGVFIFIKKGKNRKSITEKKPKKQIDYGLQMLGGAIGSRSRPEAKSVRLPQEYSDESETGYENEPGYENVSGYERVIASSKTSPKVKSAKNSMASPKEKSAKNSLASPKEKSAKSSVRIPKSGKKKK